MNPNEPASSPASSADHAADPLPARMLNEFVYCPRLFYYEYVEGVFTHNADTRRGAALHQRVDAGKGDLPPATAATPVAESQIGSGASPVGGEAAQETIHSRSVSLASERLGVTAKMDLVEIRTGDAANPGTTVNVRPVDYKIGAPREGEAGPEIWDADRMQLGLQCLILREHGYTCDEGIIYSRATKQRVPLAITPDLETWIMTQIGAARRAMLGPIPPPLVDSPKCPRCSLVTICLPDETRLLYDAPAHPDDEDTPPEQEAFGFDRDFGRSVCEPSLWVIDKPGTSITISSAVTALPARKARPR